MQRIDRDRNETARTKRIPLGTPRQKMAVSGKDPAYFYRWINDDPGRLEAAEKGGYEYVADQVSVGEGADNQVGLGAKISRVVGGNSRGFPKSAFLMRIKKEWYESDQKEKASRIDSKESALKRGQADDGGFGTEHRYIPKEGITIEQKMIR